ncbi:MAG: hypothetical protein V4596_00680 [Bdellovibrionota bacterium]
MRSHIKLILLFIPMVALMVMYQQCSGVNFQNTDAQNQWSHECSQDSSKCKVSTENFNAGTSNKKIDFVWIVDNSGSMAEEVAKTRNNMAAFATQLAGYTDLKMALLSAKDATTNPGDSNPQYFTLPSGLPAGAGTQVNTFVSSNDALIFAGLSVCPSGGSAIGSWCNTFLENKTDVDGRVIPSGSATKRWEKVYQPAISAFSGFLREQSHKVFVIVSDDDAKNAGNPYRVLSDQFLDAYDSRFPNAKPIVYSIVSPRSVADAGAAGCQVYGQGNEYIRLSGLTGGKVFDICENDWSDYFDEMLAGITILANTSFPLAAVNIVDILSVKVNNTKLNPGDYTYANRVLTIRPEVMAGFSNYNISVEILEYVN